MNDNRDDEDVELEGEDGVEADAGRRRRWRMMPTTAIDAPSGERSRPR